MTDRTTTHFRGRHYAAEHITGPLPFLNPTTRVFPLHKPQPPSADGGGGGNGDEEEAKPKELPSTFGSSSSSSSMYHVWRSRDNRKGRHRLILSPQEPTKEPPPTLRGGIARMLLRFPIWDISYDVAALFTLGSAVWVLNGFLVLLPLTNPGASWPGEAARGGGISAAVGASVFEVGSVLLMLEAVNENRSDCFGWAVEEALRGSEDVGPGRDEDREAGPGGLLWSLHRRCRHHHRNRRFTGLPQVLGVLSVPAENGIYWLPQVIGGTGFIVSSYLFMLETQPDWHTPAPRTLGWHIGLWNLIGALGFTLCGALGFVGSIIQWYESLDKYPVTIVDISTVTAPGSARSPEKTGF
ncbi:hypothetical protein KVR01_011599 [Diaporthe batatas]|uniref:uncharacterized protein n=1 Tax=Diaporthe batatas TaxID=748121 RepID=UPI001D041879|nr:uncharacterized protein KVR01_011599 [Diaporthe batatas]KAG8158477.1 hypothetical protein KVR01_011599 [Diaporthe batatas]